MTKGNKFNSILNRKGIEIIQINLGNLCNQSCNHCHIGASPEGKLNMNRITAKNIVRKIKEIKVKRVEFTGGAPEMNPNLSYFIESLASSDIDLAVRTNLTILEKSEYIHLIDLFRKHGVELIASLPDVFSDTTDHQRGKGVFKSSINVLKKLNIAGYGIGDLKLNIVYNPDGDFLPPDQSEVEDRFRSTLKNEYDIRFSNLHTIVNSPITRFEKKLKREGSFDSYTQSLIKSHNDSNNSRVMCTSLISVDYNGYIYDCDFNLALGMKIKGFEKKKFWEIDYSNFLPEISTGIHCYACTVNYGSSCHGSLKSDADENSKTDIRNLVKDYYGNSLTGTADLITNACCTTESVPEYIKPILAEIKDEIKAKYYGCGSPIPDELQDLSILDIGCGTGRDSYIMSKLAGKNGFVYGIDMTDNQISVANKYITQQMTRFGFKKPNIKFIHDYIENLNSYFEQESLDLVTSNCVINLLENKQSVLNKIFQILKYGGEFYFSDVYSDRRIPEELKGDRTLYGECLGGALYYKDFERMAVRAGFSDPRLVSSNAIEIEDERIKKLTGNISFFSRTYRLWKLSGLEDACEDYGHIAVYTGNCPWHPLSFELDSAHIFELNRPEKICGNTEKMLSKTRFSNYFKIFGDYRTHFGIFKDCGESVLDHSGSAKDKNGSCC